MRFTIFSDFPATKLEMDHEDVVVVGHVLSPVPETRTLAKAS